VTRDLAGRVGHVHHTCGAGPVLSAEDAVPQSEVERGADDHDEVGAGDGPTACLGHQERVATGHDATAHAVGQGGDAELVDEAQGGDLGAVRPDVGAQDQQRPSGAGDQRADPPEGVGVGDGAP